MEIESCRHAILKALSGVHIPRIRADARGIRKCRGGNIPLSIFLSIAVAGIQRIEVPVHAEVSEHPPGSPRNCVL